MKDVKLLGFLSQYERICKQYGYSIYMDNVIDNITGKRIDWNMKEVLFVDDTVYIFDSDGDKNTITEWFTPKGELTLKALGYEYERKFNHIEGVSIYTKKLDEYETIAIVVNKRLQTISKRKLLNDEVIYDEIPFTKEEEEAAVELFKDYYIGG